MTRKSWCGVTIAAGVLACVSSVALAVEREAVVEAMAALQADVPDLQVVSENGELRRLYGAPITYGMTPDAAADAFRTQYAEVLGVSPDELVPLGALRGGPLGEPMMYDRATGQYRFTLVRYQQQRDGVRVYDGEARVLVLNREDHPVTWVGSAVRDLGDYVVPQLRSVATDAAHAAAQTVTPLVDKFSEHETVIWAGTEKGAEQVTLAVTFVAEAGNPDFGHYEKWRYVCDAATGAVLHRENLILFENVAGSVHGLVTQGHVAEQCAAEVDTPLPYAAVQINGGASGNTDLDGDFLLNNAGTSSVTVQAFLRGTYFRVLDMAGGGTTLALSQSVTPPGPADFLFNSANTDELVRAQANGYVNANEVRDFALFYSPNYPVISTQTNFTVRVNRNDLYCPGNAWYDGTSINFCRSSIPSYPNTSFASVSQHEYGHHLVSSGGSGQGAYGEGMSDCISMLIADDPRLGVGFHYNDCVNGLRNADNTMQYPCSAEAHVCGQLLSGCVWDLREELALTNPTDYLDILIPLTIESIRLHSGSSIGRDITIDFLTLDDNDGNLGNGTPHQAQILAAFGLHNMVPLPPPPNDNCANAISVCPGTPVSGSTSDATDDGTAGCGTSSSTPDVWYKYTPQTSGSATFSLCGPGTTYDSVISVRTACSGGSELGCNDDGCGGSGAPSQVTVSVQGGQTYYVRVSGWSGRTGSFTLNVTGPACIPDTPLSITLPDGAPESILPGVATTMAVRIEEVTEPYVPGTGKLHFRADGGAFVEVPLTPVSGDDFLATFPIGDCGDTPEFYISAQASGGETVTYPDHAPAEVLSAPMGQFVYAVDDNFEADGGWSVSNSAGVTAGFWQRGVPVNDPNWIYAPIADFDGSGQCWLTENDNNPSYPDPYNTDVDGGSVTATSYLIDMSNPGVSISYAYYLRLTNSDGNDRLLVEINTNNGVGAWTEIARHTSDGGRNWRTHTITAEALATAGVTPSATTRLRFTANDGGAASVVEAGFDALKIGSFICTPPATCEDGIQNQGESRIDCGGPFPACACELDDDCDDGAYCTGVESCDAYGNCQAGEAPCGDSYCDDDLDACVECLENAHCDDGLWCNGAEVCTVGACSAGVAPCAQELACNEDEQRCEITVTCAASDVNCDGATDAGDLLSVRAPGTWQASGAPGFTRADVNGDGAVDAGDLLSIRAPGTWNTSTGPCTCP